MTRRNRQRSQTLPPEVQQLVASQMAYYDARADEYEESIFFRSGAFATESPHAVSLRLVKRAVKSLPVVGSTLELACGTGVWTRDLLDLTRELHAVDASNKMITLNRLACRGSVTYECADIFEWEPTRRFDRVATAFFMSHVPDELLAPFVETIRRANADGGDVLVIDEARAEDEDLSQAETVRQLADGSRFPIVKIYRDVEEICDVFASVRYRAALKFSAGRFFAISLTK